MTQQRWIRFTYNSTFEFDDFEECVELFETIKDFWLKKGVIENVKPCEKMIAEIEDTRDKYYQDYKDRGSPWLIMTDHKG